MCRAGHGLQPGILVSYFEAHNERFARFVGIDREVSTNFEYKNSLRYLRNFLKQKIGEICGIKRRLTFHSARHNFGTHITLSQGVPIETVCRMMGHSSIITTQLDAKITDSKLNEDGPLRSDRICGKFAIFEDRQMPVGISRNQNFRMNDNTVNPFRHGRQTHNNE